MPRVAVSRRRGMRTRERGTALRLGFFAPMAYWIWFAISVGIPAVEETQRASSLTPQSEVRIQGEHNQVREVCADTRQVSAGTRQVCAGNSGQCGHGVENPDFPETRNGVSGRQVVDLVAITLGFALMYEYTNNKYYTTSVSWGKSNTPPPR